MGQDTTIDLRSDTVTLAPEAMRRAMYDAPLGDDVYGEDPTVNALQEKVAQLTEKDAALFVASGTMGNLVACLSHCGRGDEIILGDQSHIARWEQGGASTLGGISLRTIKNEDGMFDLGELKRAINEDDPHRTVTKLIAVENTWNGLPLTPLYLHQVKELALNHNLSVHLDGARLFNAARHFKRPISDFTSAVDSVQLCFSKGLACPAGSIVAGSHEFISKARRWRKALGGGMRQAGVLAAAAIYALDNMQERLDEDHKNAELLSSGLSQLPFIKVSFGPFTNMVFFEPTTESGMDREDLVRKMKDQGILTGIEKNKGIRAVTHFGIERHDIEETIKRIASIFH